MVFMRRLVPFIWFLVLTLALQGADWPLFDRDPQRTGSTDERVLTTANVGSLHERWRVKLGEVSDSAPLVAGAMLFLTATNGTTYGIDAPTGRIVWRFVTHGPRFTTASPAFDAAGDALYVPGIDGYIHKLNPRTGAERAGNGFPARVTTSPATEKVSSAFNLSNGYLYATVSAYLGDIPPYVGHVVAVRLRDGAPAVFNALCSGRRALMEPQSCSYQGAGIWGRSGVVVDPDPSMGGRVYVATGNGRLDAQQGGSNYGDAVIALSADLQRILGFFAPDNYASLESTDMDLGSTSPALLPRQAGSATPLMAVQGGKDGVLRLLDRAHLAGVGRTIHSLLLSGGIYCAPAIWSDARGGTWIYLGLPGAVQAVRLVTINGMSRLVSAWRTPVNSLQSTLEGDSPVVSNGIVFIASNGELVALAATTGRRLWSSLRAGAGHSIGKIHWQSPVVANGVVYCSDEDGFLTAYALSPTVRGGIRRFRR